MSVVYSKEEVYPDSTRVFTKEKLYLGETGEPELEVSVFVAPKASAEFIPCKIIVSKSGVTFAEVVKDL